MTRVSQGRAAEGGTGSVVGRGVGGRLVVTPALGGSVT